MEPGMMNKDEGMRPRRLQGEAKKKQEPRKMNPFLLKRKVFTESKALLDELLEVQHFRTIYNIFVAVFCIFVLRAVLVDFIDTGRVALDFEVIVFAFGRLHMTLLPWLVMFLYTLLVPYQVLHIWVNLLKTLQLPALLTIIATVVLLIGHATVLAFYPVYTLMSQPFGPASCCIITLEQLRFLMKSYSFLRETVPPILQSRSNDGEMHLPQFSTYLYFLFCPTLIYRENYPRTPCVRWRYVIENFAKFLMCLFYGSMLFKCFTIPIFSNMNKQPLTFRSFVLIVFSATLAALYLAILIWYTFFHCWLNAFAEMMCFADRTFYKDWWNATSTSAYLRSWNVVVHDWLYCYIYHDLLWVFKLKAQSMAVLSTFIVSGAFHEYVFMMSFGFFYPLLFICWFIVIATEILGMPSTNILLWIRILFGLALLFSMQSLEWYARIHCPVQKNTFWTRVTPRTWSCYS
uniref:O-acyltransferase n=1 Tax=Anolis carolinensis TaxID=28377 RepID=A0A803TQW4_ANOCA|nr:PREDICTED: sterol O-acyltransferase 2 isoform X1 [Anolis carolinensis]|eukprot:XP_008101805.2 PREDICTED: sterol O-acyltransferase 2 isoform X1 [Anolis carolinensis]